MTPGAKFWYSNDEWHRIVETFSIPGSSQNIKLGLMLRIQASKWTRDDLRTSYALGAKGAIAVLDAIALLGEYSRPNDSEASDNPDLRRHLAQAMPHLVEAYRLLERYLEIGAHLNAEARAKPNRNNRRPFASNLMDHTAKVWKSAGGSINHGSDYKAFFSAVVKPVLDNSEIQREHGCAWTDGMFRTHVAATMKRSETPGKRGPKRKTQRSSAAKPIQN